jgi:MOSC domain-containing protein YiiM
MRLISVNVSLPRMIVHNGRTVETGIFKEPVNGRVMLRNLNLDGDGQGDLTAHGGLDKAAYVYPFEHYAHWRRELDRSDFAFGQFGENFTVEGMTEDQVYVGDVFAIGSARVQVTQPRVPCYKLAMKMNAPEFPKLFLASCRVGYYVRVLEAGDVGAGDLVERIATDREGMSVRDVCHLLYFDPQNLEGAKRALRVRALSSGWRRSFEERLARAGVPVEFGCSEDVRAADCEP